MKVASLVASSLVVFLSPLASADTTAQTLPFVETWTDTARLMTPDSWANVPGIIGYRGDNLVMTSGVDPQTVVADGSTTPVDVNPGVANPNTFSTGGVTEYEVTDPTIGLKGSGTADAPHIVIALNTTGATGVRVQYDVRDLDTDTTHNAISQIALQYRVGSTGNFTNLPAGYIADASNNSATAPLTTHVDVTLPVDAANQALVQVRVISTDALGTDEALGIDNITITTVAAATSPTAVGLSTPATANPGGAIVLTATVTPGTNPTSTGLGVLCDLSSIGGDPAALLADDGTGGDATAGDNTFTLSTTVAATTTAGPKTLACDVSDAQTRSSQFTIALTVTTAPPVCGNGAIETGEVCDDGGVTPGDGCSATCTVETGFTCTGSPSVCTDIDECTANTDDCDTNATCANTPGSFTCTCNTGYTGTGTTCADINECVTNADDCDTNATCANTPGSFTCTCNTGFMGTGTTCADIDECTLGTDTCDANAACANTAGAFTCTCNTGYTGTGMTCADIDECTAGSDNCDANASCTNTPGSFACACNAGYSGDGLTCADVDECTDGTETCDANASCTNAGGSFACMCNAGYTGDGMTCAAACGDGILVGAETCDDGDATSGDGCSATCAIEAGFTCTGTPSTCTPEDTTMPPKDDGGGCCSSSGGGTGSFLLAGIVLGVLGRRRRRR